MLLLEFLLTVYGRIEDRLFSDRLFNWSSLNIIWLTHEIALSLLEIDWLFCPGCSAWKWVLVVNFLRGCISNRCIVCCCHIDGCTMLAPCPIWGLAGVMMMRWGCLEVYVWLKPVWNWRSTTSCMETFAKFTNRAVPSSFESCSWRFLHFINSHCIVISHVILMNLIL